MEEIDLEKPPSAQLGFSIAGGISNEYVKGFVLLSRESKKTKFRMFSDHGIFITNIIPGGIADKHGRLNVGDRLVHVQSAV